MNIYWDQELIDLKLLVQTSRGDMEKMKRYLVQFLELIRERLDILEQDLQTGERTKVRQILHQMSPQLQFFGVPEVHHPINRLALEYQLMDWEEIVSIAHLVSRKLESACQEVETVLNRHF